MKKYLTKGSCTIVLIEQSFALQFQTKSLICYHLDVQELQHAVSAQQIASPHPYKKDYKEQIVGKGPHDPTIGYPEHDHHKKVGELASSVRGKALHPVR